ncbi:MAG: RNA polymerase factor sigma-54 [Candidatus Latescibacterota bacterium]
MMKLSQEMKLTQKLDFRMIQSLKLLPLNIMQLEQRINEELEINPMLQAEEPIEKVPESAETPVNDRGQVTTSSDESEHNGDFTEADWMRYIEDGFEHDYGGLDETDYTIEEREPTNTYTSTLADHLTEQLGMAVKNERDREIGEYIIGSINDDGFLDSADIDIAEGLHAPIEDVQRLIETIQQFDPPGIGARDLKETLLIQLREKGLKDSLPWKAVNDYFEDLTNRRIKNITKGLRIPDEEIKGIIEVIGALTPRPGSVFSSGASTAIIPDIFVEKIEGEYSVMLNDRYLPQLTISSNYRKLLDKNAGTPQETRKYLVDKLNSAKWFINSIEQRQSTILRVSRAIVDRQKDFLDHGITHLKPMTLQDIADTVGVAISTVQRVTTSKYMQTPQGVFMLKFFFTQRISSNDGSDDFSAKTVKDRLKTLIGEENHEKPLSDQKLTDILNQEGIDISRRAIAKYRDEIQIPPARLRKEL